MIINSDAKQLEINVAAYLSQDSILLDEVRNKVDLHEDNKNRFGLPSRLIAKIFAFRLIYGGSAYSYSVDADFAEVGYNQKQWQEVIDEYYNKYKGLAKWHTHIVQTAIATGQLVMPTGRIYTYVPNPNYRGELVWPETTIKNYPVQGTGADVMSIIRVDFAKQFKQQQIKGVLVSTVHDSIVVDVESSEQQKVVDLFNKVYEDMPKNFYKLFGKEYNLPIFNETSVGPNMKSLTEI